MVQLGQQVSERLAAFVEAHPQGWGHEEWLGLIGDLRGAGVDVPSPEQVGAALERERLVAVLRGAGVKGLGPKRREALADRFGTLWNLRHASVDDLAKVPTVPRKLAESLRGALG